MHGLPQNWRDSLSLVLALGIGAALVFAPLDGEVKGGFLTILTLIAQFYYRKKESNAGG